MRKTVLAISLCLIMLMAGIALGRWGLLRQGVLLKTGDGIALSIAPLQLFEADTGTAAVSRTININTATVEELMELPGIGQAIAGRIVEYRLEYGDFQTIEEMKAVRGIGEGVFAKLAPYISIH